MANNGEAPTLRVGKETLEDFFSLQKRGHRVTRQELLDIMAIYTTKADVNEAFKVLDHGIRKDIREIVREELEGEKTESGGLIIPITR